MARPATPADRERIRDLLPAEARATFDALPPEADAQMMVLDNDDGTLRGLLSAQVRGEAMFLQSIITARLDPEAFRLLLLGLAKRGIALGLTRGHSRTRDVAIMRFLVARYGLTAAPAGTERGKVVEWTFDVDLAEFVATLEAAG